MGTGEYIFMSYAAEKKEDSLNEWFSRNADFMNIVPRLVKAKDETEFALWFDKLRKIDPRTLYFWVKENREKLRPEYVELANAMLPKPM